MLHLICGDSGSGKTDLCIKRVRKALCEQKKIYYVVPEQQTVSVETAMAGALPASAVLQFEVTNFTRLANTVFRAVGGLAGEYATPDTKALLMYHAIDALKEQLHVRRKTVSTGTVTQYLETVRELHYAGISFEELEGFSEGTRDKRLKQKLEDLMRVGALYSELLEAHYADGEKDLDELVKRLHTYKPLAGAVIFIDGFGSLTGQQHRVFRELLSMCEVTYTLALPDDGEDMVCFDELIDTRRRLLECASQMGVEVEIIKTGSNSRSQNTALLKLCRRLLRVDSPALPPLEKMGGEACTVVAQDAFEGALAVAADICKKVEAGARFGDFAVVCANADAYKGILDTEFARCDIPYFLSEKTNIAVYEPVKLICAAYNALSGFQAQDVLAYLKCAFSDTDPDACDEFELYTQTWRLSGRDFSDPAPFDMNPDGYTDIWTAYGKEKLARVNQIKEKLHASLSPLKAALAEGVTVGEHLRLLYAFLCENKVASKLSERAAQLEALHDSESENYSRLWQVLCDLLDRMYVTLGEEVVSAATFAAMLRVAFENTDMGHIPSGTDEVLIASAPAMRDSRRHLYLFGVCEGEFPSISEGNGLFDDRERGCLRDAGVALPKTEVYATSAGLYAFYRMLCLPKESLCAVTFRYGKGRAVCRMSSLWTEAIRLLGENHTCFDTEAAPEHALLWRADSALQLLGHLANGQTGASLKAYFEAQGAYTDLIQAEQAPLENVVCRPSTVLPMTDGEATLSQSRIEQYVRCPFSYFSQYVLSLKENKTAHFEANHMGTFIHHLLECYFDATRHGKSIPDKEAFVERTAQAFMQKTAPGRSTPETEHLLQRLKRLAALIVQDLEEEFEAGDFAPVFFELPIGFAGKDAVDAVTFPVAKDGHVKVRGYADRVDAYEKDGDVYIRIVDYKTGKKKLNSGDIGKGMNLQMLLYMVSILQSDHTFRQKLGVKDGGRVLPAGVVYLNCLPQDVRLSAESDADTVMSLAKKTIGRSGIYLSDRSILGAMEHAIGNRFLPIKYTKNGAPQKYCEGALKSLQEWDALFSELEDVIVRLTGEMKRGIADATPLKEGNSRSACDYCAYKPLCRNAHPKKENA